MTDNDDNMNDELAIAAQAVPQSAFHPDGNDFLDDDESLGGDSEDLESAGGDLTPNDIFGLDPLDVLTLEELAEYLKVSPAAARRVIKEQNLPGRNIGGEWRFLRDAVANWLRGQEAPAVQQQKAREDYSKAKAPADSDNDTERYSPPPRRPFQADQAGGGDNRPKFEGRPQYGNQGGGQYGNRGGGQYGGNQYGGQQYGGGQQSGGNYGGGGGYSPPPRRPFRSAEGGQGGYGGGAESSGSGGYRSGGAGGGTQFGGGQFGGGGYSAGEQRFGGGPKRKNKRQVFDNERGKRLDRRKQDDAPEGSE